MQIYIMLYCITFNYIILYVSIFTYLFASHISYKINHFFKQQWTIKETVEEMMVMSL